MRSLKLLPVVVLFLFCLRVCAGENPQVMDATKADESSAGLWQRVLDNDFSITAPAGDAAEETKWEAKEAVYFAAKARADYPAAFTAAIDCLRLRRSRPDSIVQFKRCSIIAWTTDQQLRFRDLLKDLYARDDLAPNLRVAIHDKLFDMALSLRDLEAVKTLEQNDGFIRHWARIVGPFCTEKPLQPDTVEEFERNPRLEVYVDEFAREVNLLTDIPSSRKGSLPLAEILPQGRNGAVYLVALLQSPDDRDAILSLPPSNYHRLWLNSLPIYRGDQYQGYKLDRHLRKVRLKEGVNCLVVKLTRYASAKVRVLTPQGGIDNEIRTLAWSERADAVKPLQGMHGFLASEDLSEPGFSDVDAGAPAVKDTAMLAADLSRIEMLEHAAKYQEARRLRGELQDNWPNSSLLKIENGLFRFRESRQGIDSQERLQKEGITLFKAALEIVPEAPRAHYGIGLYLQEHDGFEEALKHLRRAVESAPNWGQALVRLAQLEKSRELDALAEAHFRAAIGNFGAADGALATFLKETGRREDAYAIHLEQWKKGTLGFNNYIGLLMNRLLDSDSEDEWDKVEEVISEYEKFYPYSWKSAANMRVNAAIGRNQIEKAYNLLLALSERTGETANYHNRLVDLALRLGWQDKAIEWLEKARSIALESGRNTLRITRRLRELRGEQWINPEYDIPLSEIEVAKYKKENYPTANQANLLKLVVLRVFPDRSMESLTHTAIKVFDKQGIASLGELSVPSDPDDLLYCRTIQPDGKVFEPTNISELNFTNAASMYNVSPGCVLEYAFRSESAGGSFASITSQFMFQSFNVPTARARFVIILPAELKEELSVKAWPRDFSPVETIKDNTITYTWDASDLEPVRPEPMMTTSSEILRNLLVLIPTKLYSGQNSAFSLPQPLQSDEAIAKLAIEITAGLTDPLDKMRALHAYVRKTLEPAEGARTPRDAMALKSGSAEVTRDLMRAMLAANDIQSYPATANINLDNNQADAPSRNSLIESFSTPLLYVDIDGNRGEWLRFFLPLRHYRPGDLGPGVLGSPALVRNDSGIISLQRVYEAKTEKLGMKYKTRVNLLPDGSARVTGVSSFSRAAAGSMRTMADRPQQGPRQIERIATSLYPRLVITDSSYPKLDSDYAGDLQATEEPFIYEFTGKIKQFCRQEGDKLSFIPFPYPLKAISGMMAPPERKIPFIIRGDIEIHQEADYTAPEGWVFTEVPQNLWWRGEFGLYVVNFVVNGRNLLVSRFLIITARKIEAKQYPAFANFLEACQRTERWGVSLKKSVDIGEDLVLSPIKEIRPSEIVDRLSFYHRWWPEESNVGKENNE